jgi:uncharacterized membrane protein YphA (DoxX/SURF4 family)
VIRAFDWLLRLGLGALFIWAGALKLRDPTTFAVEVANYHFWPRLAPYLAATLPTVEVVLGAAVIVLPSGWRRGAALALGALCAVFTFAVGQALARGINVDCGCFGGGSGPITVWTVVRDLGLLAAALVILWLAPRIETNGKIRRL